MQLGDGQAYTGLVLNSTAVGYSFEVVIKFPSLPTASGKVFELGNGYQMDEVVLNYNFASTSITFNSYRSSFTTPADIPVVTGVQAGVWYHLMVTLTQGTSTTAASSTATAYVNGVRQGSAVTNAVYPANVARTHAWLGRSDWTGEQPITALIDSFRIYDYVMPATSVQALFNLSSTGLPGTPPVVPTSFYQYQSGPQLSYTLDTAPPADQLSYNSNYSWTASSTVYPNPDGSTTPHSGVGVFNGLYPSGNSIDITALPDSQGRTFNFPIGGSMSFESWFLYYAPLRTSQPGAPSSVNGYDYIFNLGGVIGYPSNNLGLTTLGWGNAMFFAIFLNATSQHIVDTSGTIIVSTPGKWQHFILSVQQLSPSVTYGSAAANCTVYISGKAAWSQLCNVPQWVARPNGYLGRSPDDNNVRHLGEIDSWYLYNYALSAEAAAMHYVLPRAAIMEIVFDRDPQLVTNTQTSGYTWMASQGGHSGVLSLSGAATQFVDLSAYTGTNSIGTTLPSLPLSAGGAGITQTAYGWTLEVNLQLTTASTNPGMVVLDIGSSTAGTDELLLQFTPGQCSLQLVVYGGSAGTTAVTVPITGCITASTWYSVIVTASVASPTASTATYQAYLNGYAAGTAVSGRGHPQWCPPRGLHRQVHRRLVGLRRHPALPGSDRLRPSDGLRGHGHSGGVHRSGGQPRWSSSHLWQLHRHGLTRSEVLLRCCQRAVVSVRPVHRRRHLHPPPPPSRTDVQPLLPSLLVLLVLVAVQRRHRRHSHRRGGRRSHPCVHPVVPPLRRRLQDREEQVDGGGGDQQPPPRRVCGPVNPPQRRGSGDAGDGLKGHFRSRPHPPQSRCIPSIDGWRTPEWRRRSLRPPLRLSSGICIA